jgi:hypothetical protein
MMQFLSIAFIIITPKKENPRPAGFLFLLLAAAYGLT